MYYLGRYLYALFRAAFYELEKSKCLIKFQNGLYV